MGQFASSADLAALLRRTFSAADTAAANLVLDAVTGAIKAHTGQTIEKVTGDVAKLRGTWARELELPQWPVLAVSGIKLNGYTVPTGTWLLAANKIYRGNLPIFNGPDEWGGDLWITTWLGPAAIVEVTYDHGFETIPGNIKGLCLKAAARMFEGPDGATSETIGNYSYSRTEGVADSALLTEAEKAELDRWDPRP